MIDINIGVPIEYLKELWIFSPKLSQNFSMQKVSAAKTMAGK